MEMLGRENAEELMRSWLKRLALRSLEAQCDIQGETEFRGESSDTLGGGTWRHNLSLHWAP